MKLLRKLTAFILVFSLLAGTVAAISAAVFTGDPSVSAEAASAADTAGISAGSAKSEVASTAANSYTPRLTAPAYNSKYYYSDSNIFYKYGYGMPNCTCYAWGRAYELLGKAPDLCIYSAYLWYDYNRDYNYYPYGSEPKLGAIACWVYSSGTSGHVAVVEKIENGEITFSNSAYSGTEFYLTTAPVDDPSDGRGTWIFQGYIYIGDFEIAGSDDDLAPAESPDEPEGVTYRITSDTGVNLRSGAGTSYPVIGGITYNKKAVVTKTEKANGYTWGYTLYNGKSGWFVIDFAEPVDGQQTPLTPTEPSTAAPVEAPAEAPTSLPATEPTQAPAEAYTEAPAPAPTEAPSQGNPYEFAPRPDLNVVMGDLDGDGEVTILDATRIQLIIAEMFVPTKYMLIVGDYDGDSIFSILDATRIRYYLAFEKI